MEVDPPETLPIAIKTGPIASGNVVVKDGVTWDKLKKMGVRSVLGLEMEAAAIGEIARGCGVAEWIVIKGVMDHADPRKDDRFKPFAARASAEALRAFLIDRLAEATWVTESSRDPGDAPTAEPSSRWYPRTPNGKFFDELSVALDENAPKFKGIFDLALAKANEAYVVAEQAYGVADDVRVALGGAIRKAHRGKLGKVPKILKANSNEGARSVIAKIWNSHDEYLGEAAGNEADGLGVVRAYVISADDTPSLQSSYAGRHEGGQCGPIGVFTFPDQGQFADYGLVGIRASVIASIWVSAANSSVTSISVRWRPKRTICNRAGGRTARGSQWTRSRDACAVVSLWRVRSK